MGKGLFSKILKSSVKKSINKKLNNIGRLVDGQSCPNCGCPMDLITAVGMLEDTYLECPNCSLEVHEDGAEYYADEYRGEYEYSSLYDDIPPGCSACGGDYPNCIDGCPMFDD